MIISQTEVKLLSIALRNFKGQKDTVVSFGENYSAILGANESGKTSIYDAFLWLMFDRDSRGKKGVAAAKTTDGADYKHYLDHEVEAILTVDGREVKLKKVLREKWTTPRGKAEEVFGGHTMFYWKDEVEHTAGQFNEWVNSLAPVELLQCLTDLTYFSEGLAWRDRLNYLMTMSGGISNEEVAKGDKDLEDLLKAAEGKDISDFKKICQNRATATGKRLEEIPIRIKENSFSLINEDWDAIEKELAEKQAEYESLRKAQTDVAEAMKPILAMDKEASMLRLNAQNLLKQKVYEANLDCARLEKDVEKWEKIRVTIERKLLDHRTETGRLINEVTASEKRLESMREEVVDLLSKLKEAKTEETPEIGEHDLACPTCGQLLPEGDRTEKIEKLTADFESRKARKIADLELTIETLRKSGIDLKVAMSTKMELVNEADIEEKRLVEELETAKKFLEEAKSSTSQIKIYTEEDFLQEAEYLEMIQKSDELRKKASEQSVSAVDTDRMEVINKETFELRSRLYKKSANESAENRIKELEIEMRKLGAEKAREEGLVYQCERFVVERTKKMEGKINSMFKGVTFKLFKELINGGIEETCEAVVNGTTFHNANTAGQINAGLDIIGTLMSHYGISMPVFVDNVNLVTSPRILDTQMILLEVQADSELTVTEIGG